MYPPDRADMRKGRGDLQSVPVVLQIRLVFQS